MFAEIYGNIERSDVIGELRLTETSYKEGLRLPEHSHQHAAFCLISRGQVQERSYVGTLCGNTGSVLYRPPKVSHCNIFERGEVRCLSVELSAKWLEHAQACESYPKDPAVCRNSRIEHLARRIYFEWRNPDCATRLMIEGLTCELTAEFCKSNRSSESDPPPWLKEVYKLVRDRFVAPPSIGEISMEVGIHRVHVARQFRRFYGMTIGECTRRRRIEFACGKLLSRDSSAACIALEAGFSHQAHFSTVFKKVTGMTPRQYCRSNHILNTRG